jgi:hypothetical protein
MKNKILIYISLLLLGVFANSCSKDFLELHPIAADNEAAFYKTMLHADQAVTACYSQFNNRSAWDRDLIMSFGDMASDDAEAGGKNVNEVVEAENINRLITDPTGEFVDQIYGTLYRGINFANIAIEKLPSIAETDPDVNLDLLAKRIAEAKFIRAINHFYLTILFGEVPLVDHVLGPSEYSNPRASFRELFDLIEKDLKEAMEVLPERGGWNGEEGRATKGACKALLARSYLYESSYAKYYKGQDSRFDGCNERWGDALKYADEVINSGKYQLVGINGETYNTWRSPQTNGFSYIFTLEGDGSPEVVFEITCVGEGKAYDVARGQSLTHWASCRRYIDANGNSQDTEYWGLALPHPGLKAAFDPGDPRLEASIGWEGGGDSIEISGGKRYPMSFDQCVTKCYARKYEASAAQYIDAEVTWHAAPTNVKLIRFADVYLIAAEAALMTGDNTKALNYVNKVRERARMCGTSGQPAPLASVSFNDIVNERRLEFCGEGQRFFDIVRWNLAYDLLNGETFDGTALHFTRGKNEFQPIPQREIELSEGNIQQYPGW